MSDIWQEGYVVSENYPVHIHRENSAVWLNNLLAWRGLAWRTSQQYRYLDLGCGTGLQLLMMAMAEPEAVFVGVDFNAEQIALANQSKQILGLDNVHFIHAGFLAMADELHSGADYQGLLQAGSMDYIVSHGVWSWVSADNQAAMSQIIHRLIAPKGVLYLGYACAAGMAGVSVAQRFMLNMAQRLQGDILQKTAQATAYTAILAETRLGLFDAMPRLVLDMQALAQGDGDYVAHDLFSEHYKPNHSADVIRHFRQYGMHYALNAQIADNLPQLTLPTEAQALIAELPFAELQESAKDMLKMTAQRQDVYIQGTPSVPDESICHAWLNAQLFVRPRHVSKTKKLAAHPQLQHIKDVVVIGERILQLLDKPMTIYAVHEVFSDTSYLKLSVTASELDDSNLFLRKGITLGQVADVLMLLVWAGVISPVMTVDNARVQKLNHWLQAEGLPWRMDSQTGEIIDGEQLGLL